MLKILKILYTIFIRAKGNHWIFRESMFENLIYKASYSVKLMQERLSSQPQSLEKLTCATGKLCWGRHGVKRMSLDATRETRTTSFSRCWLRAGNSVRLQPWNRLVWAGRTRFCATAQDWQKFQRIFPQDTERQKPWLPSWRKPTSMPLMN